jgi:5'-3' exonuclease
MNNINDVLKDILTRKPIIQHKDDNILLVDGMNTFIRCYCGANTCNFNGVHIAGITGFIQSVGYALNRFKSTRCIIAFDGPGGSTAKRKIYPEYKLKRHMAASYNRRDDVDSEDNSK